MDHPVVDRAAFTVAGFSTGGAAHDIPRAWQALAARRADWPSMQQYGIGQPTMASLMFLAGVLLPTGATAPVGMDVREVPAGSYLQAHYSGDRRKLAGFTGQLFEGQIASADHRPAEPLLFVAKYAGDVSDPQVAQIECDIYVHLAE